jgi:hypothetical protein
LPVDIRTQKIVSMEDTREEEYGGKEFRVVEHASKSNKLKRVLADGIHDSRNNFLLHKNR